MGDLESGQVFEGRYRIDGILGRGGFSVVYDATDLDYERRVALKVVSTQGERYTGPTRARFEREITAVAELDNPHTVQVYEYGSTLGGDLYAVFEYIPGRDLAEVLNEQLRLPAYVVERILRQLLVALDDAHRAGILHRDLKPENVRVFEQDGDPWCVKLLDFGIARPAGALSSSVTKTGELIGTPRYMSPEQLTDTRLTAASDIYSLGVVAFELLAGRDALGGNSWTDQLERLQSGHQFSVAEFRDAERLQDIITRMTAFELSDRLCTAQAVLDALGEDPDITVEDDDSADQTAFFVGDREPTFVEPAPVAPPDGGPRPDILKVVGVAALVVVAGILVIVLMRPEHDTERPALPRGLLVTPSTAVAVSADTKPAAPVATPDPTPRPRAEVPATAPSGCGKEAPFIGRGHLAFGYQLDRNPWDTYIPKRYDPESNAPLMILLHDRLQDGAKLLTHSGLEDLADKHGFVVIAPTDPGLLSWMDDADRTKVHDIYEETAAQLCIDRKRVFLVAQGGGGEVAVPLSCEPWVRAVVTNSYRRTYDKFTCDRAVPMLMMSPLKSRHEKVEGGKNCKGTRQLSLAAAEEMWRERNQCTGPAQQVYQHGNSKCRRWTCEVPFESCHIDGGRGWPGVPPRHTTDTGCEGPEHNFPTPEHVWRFVESLD